MIVALGDPVTDAQLVRGIDVVRGQVRDDQIGLQNPFVHRLVDRARLDDLVGPDAQQPGILDGFLDHVIGSIQIELPPVGEVGLLAKAPNDEAGFLIG